MEIRQESKQNAVESPGDPSINTILFDEKEVITAVRILNIFKIAGADGVNTAWLL